MKKQFSIDRLIIENNHVTIRIREDADVVAGVRQVDKLIRAGCKFDGVVVRFDGGAAAENQSAVAL